MYQDAVNSFVEILEMYPEIHSITILRKDFIKITVPLHKEKEVSFGSMQLLLEWCENHLDQVSNNLK